NLQRDLISDVLLLLADLAQSEIRFGALGLNPAASEEREVGRTTVFVYGNCGKRGEALLRPVSANGEPWRSLVEGGLPRQLSAAFFSDEAAHFGASRIGPLDRLLRRGGRCFEEAHAVVEFDRAVRVDIQQPGEAVKRSLKLSLCDDEPLRFVLKLDIGAQ